MFYLFIVSSSTVCLKNWAWRPYLLFRSWWEYWRGSSRYLCYLFLMLVCRLLCTRLYAVFFQMVLEDGSRYTCAALVRRWHICLFHAALMRLPAEGLAPSEPGDLIRILTRAGHHYQNKSFSASLIISHYLLYEKKNGQINGISRKIMKSTTSEYLSLQEWISQINTVSLRAMLPQDLKWRSWRMKWWHRWQMPSVGILLMNNLNVSPTRINSTLVFT